MEKPLVALYERNELFWMGLGVFLLGVSLPESLALWRLDLPELFVVTGGGLLVASVFVGLYRLLAPA